MREGKGRIGGQEREAASKTEDPSKEKDGGSEAEAVRGNEEDVKRQEDGMESVQIRAHDGLRRLCAEWADAGP